VSRSHFHLAGVLSIRHSVQSVTERFVRLYEPDVKSWSSTEELNNALNWTHLTSQTGGEYFQSNGVSQMFTNEFIEGATRMNYGQVRQTACSPRFRPLITVPRRISTVFMDWKPLALLRQTVAVASGEETGKFLSNSSNGPERRLSSRLR
jgi:hypothetical protein